MLKTQCLCIHVRWHLQLQDERMKNDSKNVVDLKGKPKKRLSENSIKYFLALPSRWRCGLKGTFVVCLGPGWTCSTQMCNEETYGSVLIYSQVCSGVQMQTPVERITSCNFTRTYIFTFDSKGCRLRGYFSMLFSASMASGWLEREIACQYNSTQGAAVYSGNTSTCMVLKKVMAIY